jgi:hypothetical protein
VRDLHAPLRPHTGPGGARVRLGSLAAGFEQRVAELALKAGREKADNMAAKSISLHPTLAVRLAR